MTTKKPVTFSVSAKKVDFKYDYQTEGNAKIKGQGSIIVNIDSSTEKIQEEINQYVSKEVLNHLNLGSTVPDVSIQVIMNIEVTHTVILNNNITMTPR